MKDILSTCKGMTFVGEKVTMKSAMKPSGEAELDALSDAIAETFAE